MDDKENKPSATTILRNIVEAWDFTGEVNDLFLRKIDQGRKYLREIDAKCVSGKRNNYKKSTATASEIEKRESE